jgi:hypothetical protein
VLYHSDSLPRFQALTQMLAQTLIRSVEVKQKEGVDLR